MILGIEVCRMAQDPHTSRNPDFYTDDVYEQLKAPTSTRVRDTCESCCAVCLYPVSADVKRVQD